MTYYRFRYGEAVGITLDGPPGETEPPELRYGEASVSFTSDGPEYWVLLPEEWAVLPRPSGAGYDAELRYGDLTRSVRVLPDPRTGAG